MLVTACLARVGRGGACSRGPSRHMATARIMEEAKVSVRGRRPLYNCSRILAVMGMLPANNSSRLSSSGRNAPCVVQLFSSWMGRRGRLEWRDLIARNDRIWRNRTGSEPVQSNRAAGELRMMMHG